MITIGTTFCWFVTALENKIPEPILLPWEMKGHDGFWSTLGKSLLSTNSRKADKLIIGADVEVHLFEERDDIKEMCHTKPLIDYRYLVSRHLSKHAIFYRGLMDCFTPINHFL